MAFSAIYQPLDEERQEIRLLQLHPGQFEDPIRGTLGVVSLLDGPVYETTSYVCGPPEVRHSIEVNDKPFNALATSVAVLRRLRMPDVHRLVWIDSICIHQDDADEKSKQVAFMGKIYASGVRNLVYLGEVGEHEALSALNALIQLQILVDRLQEHSGFLADALGPAQFEVHETVPNFFSYEDILPLRELFKNSYFTRLWIVQEAALSADSICYWGAAPPFSLLRVLEVARIWLHCRPPYSGETLPYDQVLDENVFAAANIWEYIGHNSPGSRNCRRLLQTSRFLQTRLQQDRIYALNEQFRIYAGQGRLPIYLRPDYSKKWHEVFRDATIAWLEFDGDWIWAYQYHGNESEICNGVWPSWMAIWRTAEHSNVEEVAMIPGAKEHQPDRSLPGLKLEVCSSLQNRLRIMGVFIDTIVLTMDPVLPRNASEIPSAQSMLEKIQDWCVEVFISPLPSGCDVPMLAYSLATNGMYLQDSSKQEFFEQRESALNRYRQENPWVTPITKLPENFISNESDDKNRIATRMFGRHIFITEKELFGSGPAFTSHGDKIFVPFNGLYAHVLRHVRFASQEYAFVGTAYVHGLHASDVSRPDTPWEWITMV